MAGLTYLPAAPPAGPMKGRFAMAQEGEGNEFISRLLAAHDPPRLSDDELAKLRAHLAAPMKLSAIQTDPLETRPRFRSTST